MFYLYADLLTLLEVLAWVGLGDRWKDPDTEIVPGTKNFIRYLPIPILIIWNISKVYGQSAIGSLFPEAVFS